MSCRALHRSHRLSHTPSPGRGADRGRRARARGRGQATQLGRRQGTRHRDRRPRAGRQDVSDEEGTGIVHIAPGCGAEDYQLSLEHGLVALAPVDESGAFHDDYGWLHGLSTTEAAEQIVGDLRDRELLVRAATHEHSYPFCWRCHTPLIFRLAELMNIEAKGKNVVTTVIVPSTIDTPQNRKSMPDADFTKWVKAEEIAELVHYHSSENAWVLRETVLKIYGDS